MLCLLGVYLQQVTKRKETVIWSVCPENMCPGAKSAVEEAGLVLGGCSHVHPPQAPRAAAPPKNIAQHCLAASLLCLLPCTAFLAHTALFGQCCCSSTRLLLRLSAKMLRDVPWVNLPATTWDGGRDTRVISAKSNESKRALMPQHLN